MDIVVTHDDILGDIRNEKAHGGKASDPPRVVTGREVCRRIHTDRLGPPIDRGG
jgi:hypothetical protein